MVCFFNPLKRALAGALLIVSGVVTAADAPPPQAVAVQRLATAPVIDGELSEWKGGWITVPVHTAIEGNDKNRTDTTEVALQVGIVGDEIFVAARWADPQENRDYKLWEWKKSKKSYSRGKERDDMFALRFDMGGDFRSCMIEKANYDVDVWLWSAGRSDAQNYASDMWHRISFEMMESAAEYEMDDGTVIYISKSADDGRAGFENSKPGRKTFAGDVLPGVDIIGPPLGSVGDVAAKGVWKEGYWQLEMRRKLNTGNSDDVSLAGVKMIRSQIAVFDQGFAEHKNVSGELQLAFPN